MTDLNKKYIPINCAFHDHLEHFATLRKPVKVSYITEENATIETIENAIIFDLTGGREGEYTHIRFEGGEKVIRNDYLISIDEINVSDYSGNNCGF